MNEELVALEQAIDYWRAKAGRLTVAIHVALHEFESPNVAQGYCILQQALELESQLVR